MRDVVKGALAGLVVLALFGAVASRAGWLVASVPRPGGHGAWMLSRATGLVAYVALSLDVIAGLLVSSRAGDRWVPRAQLVDLHGWLSPLSLALVLAHAAVLVADGFVRFDAIDVLVPFAAGRETEQTQRADCLARKGLARVLPESALTPDRLAAFVAEAMALPRPWGKVKINGETETERFLAAALARRRGAAA